jgi:putative FmdB family regulatory protein
MIFVDYRCECGKIFEVTKNTVAENFPEMNCPECGSRNTHRLFNRMNYEICIGMAGNSKSKYEKQIVYHPSSYGNLKRTKI